MQPALQVIKQRLRVQLACGTAFVRRLTADILFDGIQLADSAQRLGGKWYGPCRVQVLGKPHRWRASGAAGAVVADVSPKARGAGLAITRSEDRQWRVVGMQFCGREDVAV